MSSMKKRFLIVFIWLLTWPVVAQEDAQQKLEARKEQLQKELAEMRNKYQNERVKEKSVLKEINKIEEQIKVSANLINTISKQTRLLSDDIYLTQLEINKLNRELQVMKEDYAKMIVKSYKSRSDQSKIMFILSSNSFLQAYKRIQYMKQYAGYRKMQAEEIKQKQVKLNRSVQHLEGKKKEKEVVLQESTKAKQEHEKIKQEKEKVAKSIQKDKKKYAAEIEKMKKEQRDIDRKIKKMIAEAIAAANKKNAEKTKANTGTKSGTNTKPVAVSSTKIELTPEGKVESDNFKANKGRLPWPVEKGAIYIPYGNSKHPEFSNLDVHNSGIDIKTESGMMARSVFAGEVSGIQVSQSTGTYTVMVRHGDFFTTYSNLSSVSVTQGQKVGIKQTLGKIKTNFAGLTVMKFTLSQNITTLNPNSWITPR
ncbi:peptidoglycan DD-metalloendopeptidase family protein [Flavobacterium sp.]|uniref:murein hydrolase activator EnvC family protein n=1 Tax=Flavobacterium sp. TaxID=239 RepID=UPI0025B8BCC3|nr:peptidoglycan DD-metalloendopeptidase family protein [Flavobacterium sp.]